MSSKKMTSRLKKAKEIASNPEGFKVCEGCDSIVVLSAVTCSNCHAYRFDTSVSRVVDQAIYLGGRKQVSVSIENLN